MSDLAEIIVRNEESIRAGWTRDMSKAVQRADLITKAELDEQCGALLRAIVEGVKTSGPTDVLSSGWSAARELLQEISASRARRGFSPVEVATFVLSLKRPLFSAIRETLSKSPDKLFETVWAATELLDRLALITTETYMAIREAGLPSRSWGRCVAGRRVDGRAEHSLELGMPGAQFAPPAA